MNRRQLIQQSLAVVSMSLMLPAVSLAVQRPFKIRDLYNKDLTFSDYANVEVGKPVFISGYMAPPLKANANFFVLTARPMSVCPFCETEAEWPDDILLVYTKRPVEVISYNTRITTKGILQLGTQTDSSTGFVSRVRMISSIYDRA
ncbi:MAG: hypothetical protein HRU06_00015 [Oceanospirillaceae bacterium]|nr:hypothetical protein [Oceanospirillaceae bacterium]